MSCHWSAFDAGKMRRRLSLTLGLVFYLKATDVLTLFLLATVIHCPMHGSTYVERGDHLPVARHRPKTHDNYERKSTRCSINLVLVVTKFVTCVSDTIA